jgi:hypothetical protein
VILKHNVECTPPEEEITTLHEQLALVSKESESGPTINAHGFINYALEFAMKDPHTPIEEEIVGMLHGGDATDNEPIIEVNNVQINDVLPYQHSWFVQK